MKKWISALLLALVLVGCSAPEEPTSTSPIPSPTATVTATPAATPTPTPTLTSAQTPQATQTPQQTSVTSVPEMHQQAVEDTQSVTVYITKTGSKYHRAGCQYLRKSKIAISLEEAKRSYEPCSKCKPG